MGEVGGPRVYMVRAYINHVNTAASLLTQTLLFS